MSAPPDPAPNPQPSSPPPTFAMQCSKLSVYWQECNHYYAETGNIQPCKRNAIGKKCSCKNVMPRMRDPNLPGHTETSDTGVVTGLCPACRERKGKKGKYPNEDEDEDKDEDGRKKSMQDRNEDKRLREEFVGYHRNVNVQENKRK